MALNREKVLADAQKYVEKKKYDKALVELRRVADADPNDPRVLHKIAEIEERQGSYAEALDTYESVGNLYAHGGFAQKAVAVYRHIRELIATRAPDAAARYGHIAPKLVALYREMGLTSEAMSLLEEIAKRTDAEGLDALRQIAEIDAENPLSHLRYAEALARAREIDVAVAAFRATATILERAGRGDDAIKVLERLLQHKQDLEAMRACATLYLARARGPADGMQALAKLQWCVQAAPADLDMLGLVARAFDLAGEREKAAAVRRQMALASPSS